MKQLRHTNTEPVRLETRKGAESEITGHAAVYYDGSPGTEYKLWDGAVERIMPGAFDKAIRSDDVLGLFNHDPNRILGRSSAGTLTLTSDKKGLAYRISPGNTSTANDVREHIRRGELKGSSFGFMITDETWRTEDKMEIREISGVDLFDVGPVTFPAYEATDTQARTAQAHESMEKAKRDRRMAEIELDNEKYGA